MQPRVRTCNVFRKTEFQSLSGFRVRCNEEASRPTLLTSLKFQSLSGFRVRCNVLCKEQQMTDREVSIPIGFSSTLQLHLLIWCLTDADGFNPYRVFEYVATYFLPGVVYDRVEVSIPIGFSSTLQLRRSRSFCPSGVRFQSLSGFRVRCNDI